MRKLAVAVALIVAVVVGAVLAVPYIVDVNAYKGEIAAKVAAATGRRLAIDGDIRIRLLPTPSVSVARVRLANAAGGSADEMVRLETARARLALWPLLRGDIRIESVTLVRPVIVLERLPDGGGNWVFAPAGGGGGGAAPKVSLDHLIIEDGTLVYRDGTREERLSGIDLEASAGSLAGPFRAKGTLSLGGTVVHVTASLGKLGAEPVPVGFDIGLANGGASVTFGGRMASGKLTGKLKAEATPLEKVYAVIAPNVASTGVLAAALGQSVSLTGTLDAGAGEVALNDVAISLDGTEGSGAVSAVLGKRPRLDLALSFNRLDLDRWLTAGEGGTAEGGGPFVLPAGFDATVDLGVDALVFRQQVVRQLHLVAGLDSGVVTLQQASALLPGGSDATLFGVLDAADGKPHFTGQVEASADNLRAVLNWLAVPAPSVPADRLRTLSFSSRLELTPALAKITDIDLRVDVSRLTGGVNVALARRPAFNAIVALDRINLDAYLPRQAAGTPAGGGDPLAALAAVNGEIKAEIGRLVYNATTASGIVVDAGLRDGALTLRRLSVEDVAGARGRISGKFEAAARHLEATFTVRADDLARIARVAKLALAPGLEGLGAVAADGRLAGDADRLEVDAKLAAGGAVAHVVGAVAKPLSAPAVDLTLTMSGDDLRAFAGKLGETGLPAGLAGAFSLEGKVKGVPAKLDLDTKAVVAGATLGLSGTVQALAEAPRFDLRATVAHADAGGLVAALAPGSALAGRPLGALSATVAGKGDLAKATLTGRISALGGEIGLEGTLSDLAGAATYDLALAVNHRDLRALVAHLRGAPLPAAGAVQALAATLHAAGDRGTVHIDALKATVGPSTITGTAMASWSGARPTVAIEAQADTLDSRIFAALGGGAAPPSAAPSAPSAAPAAPAPAAAGGAAPAGTGAPAERWSKAPLDLGPLKAFDGTAMLGVETLAIGARRVEKVALKARLAAGVLTVDELSGRLYGAPARLTGTLDATGTPAVAARIALEGTDLKALLADLAKTDRLGGRLTLDGRFASRGASVRDLVSGLSGKATFAARDGVVRGLDLGRLNAQIGKLSSKSDYLNLLGLALSGGETPIRRFAGTLTAKRGVLTSNDITAELDGAVGTTRLTVDLPRWRLMLDSRFQLTGHRDSPPIGVRLEGPLDNPRRTTDTKALESFVLGRVVELGVKKLAPKLGGKAAGAIEGVLQAITGGKPAAAPAPAPQAAQPAPQAAQPAPQAAQPAPQAAQPAPQAAPEPAQPVAPAPAPAPQPAPFKNLLKGLLKGIGN